MPTVFGNVCLLSGGVGPQPSHRRPQWLFTQQVAARSHSAGAAAHCSLWSHCLQFIVAYFALRMHWFTLFEDYYWTMKPLTRVSSGNGWSDWNKVVFFGETRVVSVVSLCTTHDYEDMFRQSQILQMHQCVYTLPGSRLIVEKALCRILTMKIPMLTEFKNSWPRHHFLFNIELPEGQLTASVNYLLGPYWPPTSTLISLSVLCMHVKVCGDSRL